MENNREFQGLSEYVIVFFFLYIINIFIKRKKDFQKLFFMRVTITSFYESREEEHLYYI